MVYNKENKMRGISVLLLVIYLSFLFLSLGTIVKLSYHNCSQTHCSVCLQIQSNCENLKQVSSASTVAEVCLCLYAVIVVLGVVQTQWFKRKDLVSLKVRLDN